MVVVVVVVVVAGVVRALAVVRKGRSGEATVVNFWDGFVFLALVSIGLLLERL